MAKRFTDAGKWDDEWFMNLPSCSKLLWVYLCDSCDHAGIWKVNRRLAAFKIGCDINWEESLAALGDRVSVIDGGDRWFIRKFVEFQYGPTPNEKNNAHAGVLRILDRFSLPWCELGASQPLTRGSAGALDMDKDKDSSRESAERESKQVAFKALLIRLVVADGATALRKWWALACTGPADLTFEERCDRVTWLVKTARKRGTVVNFASDVMPIAGEWRRTQEQSA